VPPPGRVYTIADWDLLGKDAVPAAVEAMAEAGVGWVQLRAKSVGGGDFYRTLEQICRALEGSDCLLWVDDRVDLAALFPPTVVVGVHLGQRDLSASQARQVFGTEPRWIGWSTHNAAQGAAAVMDSAVDVVAVGPVFPTTSKTDADPVVGLDLVRAVRRSLDPSPRPRRPLVAIGGIEPANLGRVLDAGADTVAVLGAACRGDVYRNCRELLKAAA
jgi:thiamine-phosphate pyrophosphorylase